MRDLAAANRLELRGKELHQRTHARRQESVARQDRIQRIVFALPVRQQAHECAARQVMNEIQLRLVGDAGAGQRPLVHKRRVVGTPVAVYANLASPFPRGPSNRQFFQLSFEYVS